MDIQLDHMKDLKMSILMLHLIKNNYKNNIECITWLKIYIFVVILSICDVDIVGGVALLFF